MNLFWNKKTAAYTLGEIILAMALMVFIIGAALLGWRYTSQRARHYMANLDHEIQIAMLDKKLWTDLQEHPKLDFLPKENTFTLSTPIDTIYYRSKGGKLYRKDELLTDRVLYIRYYYRGKRTEGQNIDAIEIHLHHSYQKPLTLFYFMPISAQNYP